MIEFAIYYGAAALLLFGPLIMILWDVCGNFHSTPKNFHSSGTIEDQGSTLPNESP